MIPVWTLTAIDVRKLAKQQDLRLSFSRNFKDLEVIKACPHRSAYIEGHLIYRGTLDSCMLAAVTHQPPSAAYFLWDWIDTQGIALGSCR